MSADNVLLGGEEESIKIQDGNNDLIHGHILSLPDEEQLEKSEETESFNVLNTSSDCVSEEDQSQLRHYEDMFCHRFTDKDIHYEETESAVAARPPLVDNWYVRPNRSNWQNQNRDGGERSHSGHSRGNYGGGGQDNSYRHQRHRDDRYQPYQNRPRDNYRGTYDDHSRGTQYGSGYSSRGNGQRRSGVDYDRYDRYERR